MSTSAPVETPPTEPARELAANGGEPGAAGGEPALERSWERAPLITRAQVQAAASLLARLVRLATGVAVFLIGLGIVFGVLSANAHQWLVSDAENAGRWLVTPFRQTFMLHAPKLRLALNWGIALTVYAIVGPMAAKAIQELPERIRIRG
jgi:hypothetical protein